MNKYEDLFREYEKLLARADRAFEEMQRKYPRCITCKEGCSDCCHAVFGLFPIESLYINRRFNELDADTRKQAIKQGETADRELREMEKRLKQCDAGDHEEINQVMARTRVRCPLLGEDDKCLIYRYRPVTCRVYGIPTAIKGRARVCWKAGFERGQSYPVFNLDGIYRELYRLSGEALRRAGVNNPEGAGLLVSVSRAISALPEQLATELRTTGEA